MENLLPTISIVISVYNCEIYIREMLDSILSSTFKEWECILIDDASTDNTWDVIQSYVDKRIISFKNERQEGLTKNLNKGISKARGKYIVRVDGDDIVYPDRFEKQVRFMDNNPDILLSGCSMQYFGKRYDIAKANISSDKELRVRLLFNPVIMHPTFIVRKEVLDKWNIRYNEKLRYAQDYDLLYQIIQYGRIANISDVLVKYRVHDAQISIEKKDEQKACANFTREKILELLDIELSDQEKDSWVKYCLSEYGEINDEDKQIILELQKNIIEKNQKILFFDEEILKKIFNEKNKYMDSGFRSSHYKMLSEKHLTLFRIVNQWLSAKQDNKNIADYLLNKGYKNIAIYGLGYIGRTLLKELKGTEILVNYVIDNSIETAEDDSVSVYNMNDSLEVVDAVIVTAVTWFDEIKEQLSKKIDCDVISFEQIVYEM